MKTFRRLTRRSNTRIWNLSIGLIIACMVLSGCAGLEIGDIDIISAARTVEKVAKSFQDITPEQEYYIGRAVAATVAGQYPVYNNPRANMYINVLGQVLAQASDRPETYGGYHFQILDSNEINAFAAPGGFIFITRGMLRCAQHEDAVAAVLAHEIGHIQHKHGLQAIKKSRLTSALTTLAVEGVKAKGGGDLAELTGLFQDSIADITTTMINNGYSRSFEREADRAAVTIMERIGYNPNGLIDMLHVMEDLLEPGRLDFAKTHPSPASRIADIQKNIGDYNEVETPEVRRERFVTALGNI